MKKFPCCTLFISGSVDGFMAHADAFEKPSFTPDSAGLERGHTTRRLDFLKYVTGSSFLLII
jgi:hypothetical protein